MSTIPASLVEKVTTHYLIAGLWADAWDEDGNLDEGAVHNYTPEDVHNLDDAREAVAAFLAEAILDPNAWAIVESDPMQAGHDLWLSAGGHGAGFWDRGHGEAGDRLHAMAQRLGSASIFVGDGGPDYVRG